MPSRESIAAGAALGAAKDLGFSEAEQATAMAIAAQKAREEEAKNALPKPGFRMPADSLDLPPRSAQKAAEPVDPLPPQDRPHRHHRPVRARQEGFLLKLAHWLNLK